MAYLQRLTYWLIAAAVYVLFGAITEVHAAAPLVKYRQQGFQPYTYHDAIQAACDQFGQLYATSQQGQYISSPNCAMAGNNYNILTNVTFIDDDGVQRTAGQFTAGYRTYVCFEAPNVEVAANATCQEAPPDCEATQGQIVGPVTLFTGQTAQPLYCLQGCQYAQHSKTPPYINCGDSGAMICKYQSDVDYIGVGTDCSPSENLPAPPSDPPCPSCDCVESGGGWAPDAVNGLSVCLPRGAPGTDPIKTELPPTTKKETPAPTPENPNPEPVETVTPGPVITLRPPPAGAPAGSPPEVEQTTTNPDGSTSTVTSPYPVFCESNPNNAVCMPGGGGQGGPEELSSWGGSCGAFTCTGDAVQCAIARKLHQDRCDDVASLQPYETAQQLGDKLLKGDQDQEISDFLDGTSDTVIDLPTELSEAGQHSLPANGLTDVTVSVLGRAIVVPFSQLNSILEIMGAILLALAYLVSFRIVGVV